MHRWMGSSDCRYGECFEAIILPIMDSYQNTCLHDHTLYTYSIRQGADAEYPSNIQEMEN